jgi:hypothetical protein
VLQMRAASLVPTSFVHSEFHAVHVFRYANADDVAATTSATSDS